MLPEVFWGLVAFGVSFTVLGVVAARDLGVKRLGVAVLKLVGVVGLVLVALVVLGALSDGFKTQTPNSSRSGPTFDDAMNAASCCYKCGGTQFHAIEGTCDNVNHSCNLRCLGVGR